ncbi:cytochrome c oxidase assembly protein [Nonomuraea sp. NPDC000554]|uniref:cytochrome c oxidase assembly protein n=1 Tax=Nonomuraea sp. NPDC000554 TaxID=3154259 RepID=UPI00331E0DF6
MPSTGRRTWLYAGFVFAVGVLVLVAVLRFGGGGPRPQLPGLPDAGLVTGWGLPLARFAYDACAVATVGTLLAAVVLSPRGTPEAAACVRAAGRWALGWAAATVLTYLFTLSDVIGAPLSVLFEDPVVLGFGTSLPQTQAMLVVLAGAVVVALGTRLRLNVTGNVALLGLAAFGTLPPAYVGHASSAADHDIAVSALMTHLLAASVWVGGLAAVLVHFRRSDRLPLVLRRFSTVALCCFAAVAVSGVAGGWVRLSALPELWETRYGLLLLAKTAALVALGVFGWRHRLRTVADAATRPVRRTFTLLAAGEAAVMVAAVALAVGLSRTPPPPGSGGSHNLLALEYDLEPFSASRLITEFRPDPLVLLLLALPAVGYLVGLRRLARDRLPWPAGRTFSWYAGLAVLAVVLVGGVGGYARAMLSVHALQYAALTVVAPLLLAYGAPLTLAARTTSARSQYGQITLLGSALARRLTSPAVALAAYALPLVLLYGSGWLELSASSYAVDRLTQAFFLATGLLYFWVLAGADALPKPISWTTRAWLLAAVAAIQLGLGVLMAVGPALAHSWFSLVAPPGVEDVLADQRLAGAVHMIVSATALAALAVRLTWWKQAAQQRVARA